MFIMFCSTDLDPCNDDDAYLRDILNWNRQHMSKYAMTIPCSKEHALDLLMLRIHNPKSRSELALYLTEQQELQALSVLRLWCDLQQVFVTTNGDLRRARAITVRERHFIQPICSCLPACNSKYHADKLVSSSPSEMLEAVTVLKKECILFIEERINARWSPRDVLSVFDTVS